MLQLTFPRLAAAAERGAEDVAAVVRRTAAPLVVLSWLGAALLVATSVPVARVFVLGPGSGRADALAGPVAALAPAVLAFALMGLATRTLLAQHRALAAGTTTALAWGTVTLAALVAGAGVPSRVARRRAGRQRVAGALRRRGRRLGGAHQDDDAARDRPALLAGAGAAVPASSRAARSPGSGGTPGCCPRPASPSRRRCSPPPSSSACSPWSGVRCSRDLGAAAPRAHPPGRRLGGRPCLSPDGPGPRVAMVLTASTGGIGRHVASVAPRLVARGFDVTVHAAPVTLEAHDFGVPAVALDASRPSPRGVRRAAVVHAHGYKAAALALPYARAEPGAARRHLAQRRARGGAAHARAGRILQRMVARGADLVLAASSDLLASAVALGAHEAVLAPVAAPALRVAGGPRPGRRTRSGWARRRPGRDRDPAGPQKNLTCSSTSRPDGPPARARVRAGRPGPLHDALARPGRRRAPARHARRGERRRRVVAPGRGPGASALALGGACARRAGGPAGRRPARGHPGRRGPGAGRDAAVLVDPDDPEAAARAVRTLADDPQARHRLADAGLQQAVTWPGEDDVADDLAAVLPPARRARTSRHPARLGPPDARSAAADSGSPGRPAPRRRARGLGRSPSN